MITVTNSQLHVQTKTLQATFDRGVLVSLVRRRDGKQFIRQEAKGLNPLQLLFTHAEAVPLGSESRDSVVLVALNDHRAEIRVHSWYGDGLLAISEDVETGDLIVEPSAYSSRPGLRACRWALGGIEKSLELVAPFFQGVKLPLEDELVADNRWQWPNFWEAGFAILQGADGGFWVHCRDTQYRYKALQVGLPKQPRALGLETENYGPIDAHLAAGGIAWRLNVHDGDWRQPAGLYRNWLEKTWQPDKCDRPAWVKDIRFAISWCPCQEAILDELAKVLKPSTVLLHVPHWRSDPYDENYPTFEASDQGRAFMKKAQAMGYRVMPHFNSIDMDPIHPVYTLLRDFAYRAVESKRIEGWTYDNGVKPVQESNAGRLLYRDKKTMVKIHPGLAMWRSILTEHVSKAVKDLDLRAVFLDVTLNTWNLYNCLVENQTSTEGMKRLIDEVACVRPAMAMGGEGRNEITMQNQCFGQVHLLKSWQDSLPGLARCGQAAVNEFLFGQWCRCFGYSGLSGQNADSEMRMTLHSSLGAIPTVTIGSAEEIRQPNKAVQKVLDAAK